MKKVWKFLTSMKLAIALLLILAAACAGASFINQGQTYEFYARMYSERTAGLILALSLDDAFHSWWFIAINAFLCLNLLGCNLIRLPQLIGFWGCGRSETSLRKFTQIHSSLRRLW